MAQKNKILPYVIFGVPIAIGLYFVYKAIRNSMSKGKEAPSNFDPKKDNSDVVPTKNGGGKPTISSYFPLKKGSKGAKVIELQNAILKYDNTLLGKYGADGDFGSITEKALQTILGKTSVESQDEIDEIIKKGKSNQDIKVGNDNRKVLGQKLMSMFKANTNLKWKALNDTQVSLYNLTSDGRTIFNKTIVLKKGEILPTQTTGGDPFNKISLYDDGFINLSSTKYSRTFSPYAFELV